MPRTALIPATSTSTGLAAAYVAGDNVNGMSVPWAPGRVLHIKNTTGGAITVTAPIPATVAGKAVASQTVSVPATTGERFMGPFESAHVQTDGSVYLDFSATGTTVTVVDVPRVG